MKNSEKSGMINEPTFIEEGVRNLKILFQFDSVVTSMSLGIPKLSLPHYHAIKLKRWYLSTALSSTAPSETILDR